MFGSSALTEQGITLAVLVTQYTSLLGLCVRHLSGNVINYWWYTGLYIYQVWSHSDHPLWVLQFSQTVVYIETSANRCKMAWDIIKTNVPQRVNNKVAISCDEFNQYLSNLPNMISSQLNFSNILATDLLINLPKPNQVFEWKHIGIEDIFQIVGSLKNTNSKDYYDVSNKFLKQIIPYIALPLTICINDSLNTGLFPDCLKISKVIPIFKSGDASEPSNYRPISVIPIFAKIFETVMRRQICEYFEN